MNGSRLTPSVINVGGDGTESMNAKELFRHDMRRKETRQFLTTGGGGGSFRVSRSFGSKQFGSKYGSRYGTMGGHIQDAEQAGSAAPSEGGIPTSNDNIKDTTGLSALAEVQGWRVESDSSDDSTQSIPEIQKKGTMRRTESVDFADIGDTKELSREESETSARSAPADGNAHV
eukprot:GHVN01054574.1.p1 GENE.GHVN01054574.1~~GHVN01054574.1.p1  ORF type:complete len:174 (+),score=22.56 GHVN01054574.1:532-1053(+)